jgi:hypothetical protein
MVVPRGEPEHRAATRDNHSVRVVRGLVVAPNKSEGGQLSVSPGRTRGLGPVRTALTEATFA